MLLDLRITVVRSLTSKARLIYVHANMSVACSPCCVRNMWHPSRRFGDSWRKQYSCLCPLLGSEQGHNHHRPLSQTCSTVRCPNLREDGNESKQEGPSGAATSETHSITAGCLLPCYNTSVFCQLFGLPSHMGLDEYLSWPPK